METSVLKWNPVRLNAISMDDELSSFFSFLFFFIVIGENHPELKTHKQIPRPKDEFGQMLLLAKGMTPQQHPSKHC